MLVFLILGLAVLFLCILLFIINHDQMEWFDGPPPPWYWSGWTWLAVATFFFAVASL